jgi:hypothetical protein
MDADREYDRNWLPLFIKTAPVRCQRQDVEILPPPNEVLAPESQVNGIFQKLRSLRRP